MVLSERSQFALKFLITSVAGVQKGESESGGMKNSDAVLVYMQIVLPLSVVQQLDCKY